MAKFSVRPPYVIKVFLSRSFCGSIHSHSVSVGFGSVGDLRKSSSESFKIFLKICEDESESSTALLPFFLKACFYFFAHYLTSVGQSAGCRDRGGRAQTYFGLIQLQSASDR